MRYTKILLALVLSQIVSVAQTPTPSPDAALLEDAKKAGIKSVELFSQRKYVEALPLAEKAVELRKKALGKYHLSLANSLRNLAYIYLELRKFDEAEKAFEDSFEIFEKNQPLDKVNQGTYADILQVTAVFQASKAKWEKAESNIKRSLEMQETLFGKDSAEVATGLRRMADVYQAEEKDEQAIPLLKRAFEINLANFGKGDERTSMVFGELTCSLGKTGQENEKRELIDKYYPVPKVEALDPDPRPILGGVVNGKAVKMVKPSYPEKAKSKRVKGTVNVQITINEQGTVISACAVSGPRELMRVSEIAAYNWRFTPTTLLGKPVKVTGVVVFNFTL